MPTFYHFCLAPSTIVFLKNPPYPIAFPNNPTSLVINLPKSATFPASGLVSMSLAILYFGLGLDGGIGGCSNTCYCGNGKSSGLLGTLGPPISLPYNLTCTIGLSYWLRHQCVSYGRWLCRTSHCTYLFAWYATYISVWLMESCGLFVEWLNSVLG